MSEEMMRYGKGDCARILAEASFELLLTRPGIGYEQWLHAMARDYGIEVADACGRCGLRAEARLRALWESRYEDDRTGVAMEMREWAEALANEQSVRMYMLMAKEIHAHFHAQ